MFKKIVILLLVFLYMYTLTFNVFMTSVIRIPAPLAFGLPLVFLFNKKADGVFLYGREIFFFLVASVFLFLYAQEIINVFFAIVITITCVALYFNYFVGDDLARLKLSVWVFYLLLVLSSIVMLLNHVYPAITPLRALLVGSIVKQAPSGITPYIFSFGYQLAALVTFVVIAATAFKKHLFFKLLAFGIAMVLILYGMNRSVLLVFLVSVGLYWFLYYRLRTVLLVAVLASFSILFKSQIADLSTGRKENILAKNEKNSDEKRSSLTIENLKIIADNPFGIAFSKKSWREVAGQNPVFRMGDEGLITSHNAYLMFITYLGIVLGGALLFFFYQKVARIFWFALHHVRSPEFPLLVSLCFSFFAVSLNSFFHNEWILAGSGPTLFLYFCILHLSKLQKVQDTDQ